MLCTRDRQVFDDILDQTIDRLPQQLHDLLEEVPLIVEDEPSPALLADMEMDADDDLCGLHWGTPITERGTETAIDFPDRMMLFRGPIMRLAGYPGSGSGNRALTELRKQIRITLLHEIGHHFGLEEEDLDALGYG